MSKENIFNKIGDFFANMEKPITTYLYDVLLILVCIIIVILSFVLLTFYGYFIHPDMFSFSDSSSTTSSSSSSPSKSSSSTKSFTKEGIHLTITAFILAVMFLISAFIIPSLSGITLILYIYVIITLGLSIFATGVLKTFDIRSKGNVTFEMIVFVYSSIFVLSLLGLGLYFGIVYLFPQVTGILLALCIFLFCFLYISIFIIMIVKFYELFTQEKYPLGKYFKNWGIGLLAGIGIIAFIFGFMFLFSFFSSHLLILKIAIIIIAILLLAALVKKIPNIDKINNLVVNVFLYLPCFINSGLQNIFGNSTELFLLMLEIILIILYLYYPEIQSKLYMKNGTQLINRPVKLYEMNSLGTTQQLNQSEERNYSYAMSFWFYLDSEPPSINSLYTKEGNILHLGKTPSVRYKSATNQILVSVENNDQTMKTDRVIAKIPDIQLQKWNQIIINYSGGTMDVFYNGKLFSSAIEVVPYQTFDILEVGQENGISGGLANLMYYRKTLDIYTIRQLYNSFKGKDPPALSYPNKTIIPMS